MTGVVVRHSEWGNRKCRCSTGPYEYKVKLKEGTERTGRVVYLHNVEFERKYDTDSVEFKSRSG